MSFDIQDAAAALRRGAVACFPTESSYGLAADPRSPDGIAALLALKGGRGGAPIALIAADEAQAREIAARWPARAAALAAAHWPGPLTLVVPAAAHLPAAVVAPDGGVGVRVSSCEPARALAAALGMPITATSANPSGEPPATTITQARPGTVARVADDGTITVIRAGAVDLSRVLDVPSGHG